MHHLLIAEREALQVQKHQLIVTNGIMACAYQLAIVWYCACLIYIDASCVMHVVSICI